MSPRCRFLSHFAWRTRRAQILIMGLALVALGAGVVLLPQLRPPPAASFPAASDWLTWQDNLQSIFGLATLIVALFVWFGELREDWEESLPKLLNVYFFHEGQPVIVCRHAYLAGESDIRQWGQQIGAQMADDRNLAFRPNLDAREAELVITPDGQARKRYYVRFHLTQLPAKLEAHPGQCLWRDMLEGPMDPELSPSLELAGLPEVQAWPQPLGCGEKSLQV